VTLIVALYLLAALFLAWLSRFQINPDGVAYIQHARHWAHGEVALAVNSWWSPLLSWLLVPFVWARIDSTLGAKLLNVIFGVGFAGGVQAIVRELTGGRHSRIAFVAALLLALVMLPELITPDLLLTCLLTWYFALAMRLFRSDSPALGAGAGFVAGLAGLAKAYAIPFVTLHITMTMLLKFRRIQRGASVLEQYGMGLAVLTAMTVPWAAAISVHDGKATISSAGQYWTAWSPMPAPKPREAVRYLQVPRQGRLTTLEDPMEIRHPWSVWSPFDGLTGLRYQLLTLLQNLARLPQYLGTSDVLGLLPVSFIFAVVFLLPLRETLKTDDGNLRLWACLSVIFFVAGYMLVYLTPRYLWPIRGLLLALAIAGPGRHWFRGVGNQRVDGGASATTLTVWHRVLVLVLVASVALKVADTVHDWRGQHVVTADWKRAGEGLAPGCRFAATDYHRGLYITYWARGVFLGELTGRTPEEVARELAPFGDVTVLIRKDDPLASALSWSPMFAGLDLDSAVFQAFGLKGGGCPRARRAAMPGPTS
jgi:hypothetical protein